MSAEYSLTDNGVYYLSGEITYESTKNVITWILENNIRNSFECLKLIITSPGGDVNAAFALIDTMRGSSIPIHTVGLGLIASAGLTIFIAGEPGHRIITPNTAILSHQWTCGSYGKEHELLAANKRFDLLTTSVINHYKSCTGLTEKIIKEKLLPPQDVWLSAQEAKKYKLVDRIKNM